MRKRLPFPAAIRRKGRRFFVEVHSGMLIL